MKPTVIHILTAFLGALLLSASFAAGQDQDRFENTCWWSAWRACLTTTGAIAAAEVEPAKADAKAEEVEQTTPASVDEARQIKTTAREAVEEEEAAGKSKADSATVEIEITIRIGGTERTVKLEMPMDDFQVPVIKAKAIRKAKSEEDQTVAAVHVPATSVAAESPIKEEIKAADERKSVARSGEIEEGDPLLKEVAVMVRQSVNEDVAGVQIDPVLWEKLEIPALPAASMQWRATFANAFGGMQEMLSSMWQQTSSFMATMSKLAATADASQSPE